MKARVATTQMIDLQTLDRLHVFWFDQLSFFVNMSQFLDSIDQEGCSWTKEVRSFPCYHFSVWQFKRQGWLPCCFLFLAGKDGYFPIIWCNPQIIHQELNLLHSSFADTLCLDIQDGLVIATDDFLLRGFDRSFIVHNGKTDHVDAHICRRSVRRGS